MDLCGLCNNGTFVCNYFKFGPVVSGVICAILVEGMMMTFVRNHLEFGLVVLEKMFFKVLIILALAVTLFNRVEPLL